MSMTRLLGNGLLAACLLAASATRADAQSSSGPLQATVSLETQLHDNFYQAPSGAPATTLRAHRLVGRLGRRVGPERRVTVFGEAGRTRYQGLSGSTLFGGGVAAGGGRHALDVSVRFELDRPTLDVGDEFGQADTLRATVEYGYRVTGWLEAKALADVQHQAFEFAPGKTNTLTGLGGAVRYRGFGSLISPEVGIKTGSRAAAAENERHSQTDLYVKVRSLPAPRVYLSVQYRHRVRDYSVPDPLSSNFERQDRRDEITALTQVRLVDHVAANVYYALQDANSTLARRTFATQLISVGLSVGW